MSPAFTLGLVLMTACSSNDQPPTKERGSETNDKAPVPTDDELLALANRVFEMQEALIRAGEAAGSDCGRMVREFGRIIDANKGLLDKDLNERMDAHAARFDRLINEKRAARYNAVVQGLLAATRSCADDQALQKTLKRLD